MNGSFKFKKIPEIKAIWPVHHIIWLNKRACSTNMAQMRLRVKSKNEGVPWMERDMFRGAMSLKSLRTTDLQDGRHVKKI